MNEPEFKSNMLAAQTFHGLSSTQQYDGSSDFWMGYIRGLRRCYHGNNFGTEVEHKTWLSFDDSPDLACRMRTLGYRTGLAGENIQQAINIIDIERSRHA